MGILVITDLAFGGFLHAPFLDNGPGLRQYKRPIAVAMMLIAVSGVMWLTYESTSVVDWDARAEANKPNPESDIENDTEDPGYDVYENSCMCCHGDDLSGTGNGPALIGTEHDGDEIATIASKGISL